MPVTAQEVMQPGADTKAHVAPTQTAVADAIGQLYNVQVHPNAVTPAESQTPVTPELKDVMTPVHTDSDWEDMMNGLNGRPRTESSKHFLQAFLQKLHLQNPDNDIEPTK